MGAKRQKDMDIKKITELMAVPRWRDMLRELPPGKHTLPFASINAIKSCKATAYDLNSDNSGRKYYFNVNKENLSVVITVEEQ